MTAAQPYVDRIILTLNDLFPSNWAETYFFHLDTNKWEERKDNFTNTLRTALEEIFDDLNLSVLEGEYLTQLDYIARLRDIADAIDTLQYYSINENVNSFILSTLKEEFIDFFKSILNIYIDFVYQVNRKIKLEPKINLFSFNSGAEIHKQKFSTPKNDELLDFFIDNLNTAYYDIFLQSSEEIEELNELYGRIRSYEIDKPYTNLFIAKTEFLIAKLILRKQFLQYKSKSDPVYISDGYNEHPANAVKFVRNEYFKSWIEYASAHYLADYSESKKAQLKDAFLRIKEIRPSQIVEIWDLHRLIKFYKDTTIPSNIERLREIRDVLYSKFLQERNSLLTHDLYSLRVNLNYAVNNEFSALCSAEISDAEIEKVYTKVLEIQDLTGIKNFFPQHKYIGLLLEKIRSIYKGKKSIQSSKELRAYITKCKTLLNYYEINVKWAEYNYNYAFCLPFNECIIEIAESQSKIFIFSSFVLPLEKEIYLEDFNKYKDEISVLEKTIDVIENIETDVQNFNSLKSSLETNLQKFQDETRNREVKSMEVLGIFTAIITFLAASIPSFKFVKDFKQAILFMIALSLSLAVFVLAIIFIRRLHELGFRGVRRFRRVIFWVIVLGLITWALLIFSSGLEMYKDNKAKSNQNGTQQQGTKQRQTPVTGAIPNPSNVPTPSVDTPYKHEKTQVPFKE